MSRPVRCLSCFASADFALEARGFVCIVYCARAECQEALLVPFVCDTNVPDDAVIVRLRLPGTWRLTPHVISRTTH